MTVATGPQARPTAGKVGRTLSDPVRGWLSTAGRWVVFIGQTLWYLPLAARRYPRQTMQAMNGLAWGRGSVIVDGGVLSVMLVMGAAMGAAVAIESFSILNLLGFGSLSGIIGGTANVRTMAPLVTGIAFVIQAGCRMTAEIGSMRISDEIDTTEAMGLRPIPFVVGTRLIGAMLCVIPGYVVVLITSFYAAHIVIERFRDQPAGTYNHYFEQFLSPADIGYSLAKAVIFCALATLIHCYYGYFATGGPVGLGIASGRAVRASLVTITVVNFILTVAFWGARPEFVFTG